MDIRPPFVADGQPAVLAEPGQGALDDPAVPAQLLTGVNAFASDADPDVALGQGATTARDVVGLVGMQLVWPLAAMPVGLRDGRHGIEHGLEDDRFVAVGPRQEFGQRDAAALGQDVPFGAGFAAIRGIGSDRIAPLLAGMLAQSRLARDQSIWPASPRRSRST